MDIKNMILPLLAVLSLLPVSISCNSGSYQTITGYAQGGTYVVKYSSENTALTPARVKAATDSILNAIDNSISGYNKNSLLSAFNSGKTIRPDRIFIDIYAKSRVYWEMTGGCVDVACGPLFDLWGFGFTSDSLPSDKKVREVLAGVGMQRLKSAIVPDEDGTFSPEDLLKDGSGDVLPKLNYNAVAQGYSCDLIAEYLLSAGIENMLVDVGGEIYCKGVNPSGRPWTLGLDSPFDGNNTPGENLKGTFSCGPEPVGVVTSGNYRKYYIREGRKYAHTIDPRTGAPVTHSLLSATIIGPDAAESDALATFCMVVGLDEASRYITGRDDLEGYLVYDEDGEMKAWASDGFYMNESL